MNRFEHNGVWTLAKAVLALVCAATPAFGDANDGEPEYVVIKAAKVITVAGEEHSPGTVVIEDGKIAAAGGDIEYPSSARLIRAPRETVLPGFVLPRTRYGLASYSRAGVHGDRTAASEVYLSELDFHDLLEAGYTTVCYVPDGRGLTGMAAVYRTAGPEDSRRLVESAYLDAPLNWSSGGKGTLRKALKKATEEIEKVEKARKEWEAKQKAAKEAKEKEKEEVKPAPEDESGDEVEEQGRIAEIARARLGDHNDNDNSDEDEEGDDEKEEKPGEDKPKSEKEPAEFKPPEIDPAHQPLVDLLQKKEGALMTVHLDKASDLRHFDDVLEPYEEIKYNLFLTARRFMDFHNVEQLLGKRKAKVTLYPLIQFLPQSRNRYNLAARLVKAGCSVGVVPLFDSREEYRRVRERLATLVRAGLPREAALRALTLDAAAAIGLDARLGSIEKGKDADLVFLDGDPLDPHASVTRVVILGETVWEADKP